MTARGKRGQAEEGGGGCWGRVFLEHVFQNFLEHV